MSEVHLNFLNEKSERFKRLTRSSDEYKRMPIIVVSAHAYPNDIKAAVQAGCDEYLVKPVKIVDLMEKIKEYLKD